jgi:predicted permease
VQSAALALVPLLQDNEWDNSLTIEGYAPKVGEYPDPHMQWCSPGFFAAMKIPILLGREFTIKDEIGAPKVGIVNQKLAKRYFGDANPVGRHVGMGIDPGTKMDIEIVGVAGDTKYENMREEVPFELYLPFLQRDYSDGLTAYVRAAGDPTGIFNVMRQVVRDVDASVPMEDLRTLDEQIELSLYTERLLATLSGVFGGLATILAAIGLYGVMAFTVARRTREIGIRMALGAGSRSVVWMVMREVLALASIGMAIGLGAGWAATRLVKAQLFGINPADGLTMGLAALGIAMVAALSGYMPARRATRIDPVRALRWE